ncbi:MAG: prephenate dehydratase [Gammaproteobacteria bacterium]
MNDRDALNVAREQIDELDAGIMRLISERAEVALNVARIKRQTDADAPCYRPEREAEVLRRVLARNKGPLSEEEMARLFREIMSACLALEQPLKVAFLGPEGTFTQEAVLKHFGHSVKAIALGAIDQVFREVESGATHYGVVPIENSTEGVVNHTLDMFLQSSLKINGEVELRIHHHLLSTLDEAAKVERVYSHQQSLAQCRGWLDSNLPQAERIAVSSNAEGARRARGEGNAAAIAGDAAARTYGLRALRNNIEDNPNNITRFLIIGRQRVPPSGFDKTSLVVSGRNQPGLLCRLLAPLAQNGVSMTRIASRPSQLVNWEYVFFLDVEGHMDDGNLKPALDDLEKLGDLFKVLGSYPRAVL